MKEKTIFQELASDKKYIIILSIFTFFFLFFTSKMSPLYPINEWSDINVYFNIGKAAMEGRTLYTESFDHKGPLIFIIYGIGYLISNSTFLGVFIIELIGWLILIYTIFLTARIYLQREFSFIISLIVPAFLIKYTHTGGSAEEFILIMSVVSLYFFYRFFMDENTTVHNPKYMFLHGILFSMVFFIKLNLVIFWVFPILGILICILIHKEYKNLLHNILSFILGVFVIAVPICLYLYINNALTEAFNVYILLNMKYGSPLSASDTMNHTFMRTYSFFRNDIVGFIIMSIGALYFPIKHIKNKIGKVSMILCALSLFFILFTPRTFHFYYPLSFYIFIIPGLISISLFIKRYVYISYSGKLLCLFATLALLVGISSKNFFGLGGYEITRQIDPNSPEFQFSRIIDTEKNPTLLNLGSGYGNSIFTICNITPNVKYFLTPNIYYNMYPQMRDEQTKYIENKEVDFIVVDNFSFNYQHFRNLQAFKENYILMDTFVNKRIVFGDEFSTYYLYRKR